MREIKQLENEQRYFATMTAVVKTVPYQSNGVEHPLIDTYGTEEFKREMLLCNGGGGRSGWVRIKSTGFDGDPDFHKRVAEKFNLGDVIEVTGTIEEKEKNGQYNRTLKVMKLNKVKVVNGTDTTKRITALVCGIIDELSDDNLVLVIPKKNQNPESKKKESKIHLKLGKNEDSQWIKDSLKVGDVVKVGATHYDKVVKDSEGNFKERINCLVIGEVEGYRKVNQD